MFYSSFLLSLSNFYLFLCQISLSTECCEHKELNIYLYLSDIVVIESFINLYNLIRNLSHFLALMKGKAE